MRPFHPLADIFPLIEGEEFNQLVASIKASAGPRDPIVIHDGMIIDGRNRARACEELGIEPSCEPLPSGSDPIAFVMDKNLRRRHLNDSQRAMAAAELEGYSHGGDRRSDQDANLHLDRDGAAQLLSVSTRSVADAAKVKNEAAPELVAAVKRGEIAVSAAAHAADLSVEDQRHIVEEARAGRKNAASAAIKKKKREKRERDLANKQRALPEKKYGVIVCDDEWDHEVWSRETGMDRHAGNHYEVASDAHSAAELHERTKARFECAAPDCFLGMWATVQHLAIAIELMRLRGFRYVSHYVWGKDKIGLGFWNRNQHEILLIGVRGKVPCPAPGTQWSSLITAPRGEHSAKPEIFLQMIEEYFPTLPKIELNRRGPARRGWDPWGNEAELPARGPEDGEVNTAEFASAVAAPMVALSADDDLEIPNFLRIGAPECSWRSPLE